MLKCSRQVDDARNGYVTYRGQFLFYAQARFQRTLSHCDKALVLFRAEGGVNGHGQAVGVFFFYRFHGLLEVQGMDRIGKGAVYTAAVQMFFCQAVAYERSKAVAGDAVASNTEEDKFFKIAVGFGV